MSLEADYVPDVMKDCDFSGYIVKYDVISMDGYSMAKDAFKKQDREAITIVNNFYEGIPVGICLLCNDSIGLYGRCFLKNNPNAEEVFQDVKEGMVDAFIVNLENVTTDVKDPKMVLSGTIKNIMMDQHENGRYISSIDFINKDISDEETEKALDKHFEEKKTSIYKKITLTMNDVKDPHDFHALPWTVDVLGTRYNIISADRNTNDRRLEGANAYCDYYAKEIVAIKYEETEESFKDIHAFNRKTLRHEIVHAFLAESGLRRSCSWAENEEVVDWIAIQFPKMFKAFKEAGALNSEDLK